MPWWSLALSAFALTVLGTTVAVQVVPAAIGALVTPAMAACCLLLIVAEAVHRAEGRTGGGGR